MRVKLYAVDITLPRWTRRALVFGGIPLAIIGVGALVYAASVKGQDDFVDNQVLSASVMNGHFKALQDQIDSHAAPQDNEPWHVIGEDGQPAFQSSWRNYGSVYEKARFKKDAHGVVHVVGIVNAGNPSTVIFTLPVGYRPRYSLSRTATAYSAANATLYPAVVLVSTNGDVTAVFGGPAPTTELDIGIQFFLD